MKHWTQKEKKFLIKYYPFKGKEWCMENLKKSERSVRSQASHLKLRLSRNSEFFKDFHYRSNIKRRGRIQSKETKIKIGLSHLGKNYLSSEQRSGMTKKWIKEKGHPRGMLGKHHSKATKENYSKMRKGKKFDNLSLKERQRRSNVMQKFILKNRQKWGFSESSSKWGHIERGKREDLNNIFFRSKWEANYARYLNWLKEKGDIIDWEYEPKTFIFEEIKLGTRSYTPDFRVIEKDGYEENYHEVKGWMDSKGNTKLKRMAKYYPEVRITLIDGESYRHISQQMSKLIPNWE